MTGHSQALMTRKLVKGMKQLTLVLIFILLLTYSSTRLQDRGRRDLKGREGGEILGERGNASWPKSRASEMQATSEPLSSHIPSPARRPHTHFVSYPTTKPPAHDATCCQCSTIRHDGHLSATVRERLLLEDDRFLREQKQRITITSIYHGGAA